MKKIVLLMILLMPALLLLKPQKTFAQQDTKPAVQAADTWLGLVDAEKYPEAYKGFSSFFKERMTEEKWTEQVKSARSIFGKVQTRKLKAATPATSLPGAPDGNYVVVQYDTTFEKKQAAVETVTMSLEKDNKWGVVGYYIK